MRRPEKLSAAAARRVALAAQGLHRPRRQVEPSRAAMLRKVESLGALQIDSVSAVVRSHYLPLFSRLGPYQRPLLDGLAYDGRRRRLFEYWGHEASLLPVSLQPLLRWRMARAREGRGIYSGLARFGSERRAFVDEVLDEVGRSGPLAAGDLAEGGRGQGGWWGWSDGKLALEWLFWAGLVSTATRRGFERVYDLTERVLPKQVAEAPTPGASEAQRALLAIAARALGVATAIDLREYFRLEPADANARIAELEEAGQLLPVQVEGWERQAWLDPAAVLPRRAEGSALLSPFDSLVWERDRTERVFGFRYRLEFYTPAHRRVHGYYVMPFLLGDRLVARVDLRSDRAAGCLRVIAIHLEPGALSGSVIEALRPELACLAAWLSLERVEGLEGALVD
ncbi:MAG: winged helix-turn-helix domain-containing protein [Geminicoccaceae bacterium]